MKSFVEMRSPSQRLCVRVFVASVVVWPGQRTGPDAAPALLLSP